MRDKSHKCPECPRTQGTEVPRVLLSQLLHPQEEEPDAVARIPVPVDAVEAILVEVARDETVAIHAEGVARRVQVLERHPLTRALEVRHDEGEQERDAPERGAVVSGQLVLLRHILAELLHLGDGLARRVLHQTRNPEHERVLGGLVVGEVPVLQVLQLVVARPRERSMRLEREARLDLPGDRAGVADVAGVLAPLGDECLWPAFCCTSCSRRAS